MAAFNKVNSYVQNLGRKVYNLHTDVLKAMLTNVAPTAASAVKADITEIAAGNGYVAGGVALANQSYTQSGGVAKLSADDISIVAAGGAIGPFRWLVLYDDTAANDELIGYYDYGSSITLNDGEELKGDINQANGILTDT